MPSEQQTTQDAPNVIMLPPVLMVLHITAGLVLNWFFAASMGHGWGWFGLLLLGVSVGIVQWSRGLFQKAGTNVPPNLPTLVLVTHGPYQYSRNPMYLCFLIWLAGLALVADAPLMLLMLVPFWYILDRHVIAPEEKYLTEKFGSVYTEYQAKARRWL